MAAIEKVKVCIRALQPIILDRTSNYRDFSEGMHSINRLVDHNLIIPAFTCVSFVCTFIKIHTIQNIQRRHYKRIFHGT